MTANSENHLVFHCDAEGQRESFRIRTSATTSPRSAKDGCGEDQDDSRKTSSRKNCCRVPHLALKEVMATTQGDPSHKRRMHTQEPIMARRFTLWGTRASGQGFAWKHGKTATRCAPEGRERIGMGADGASKLSAVSQRLLKRWRDRRESVAEPPINKKRARV